MSKFPKDFLVGAATAAHQVEGNNTNSDCWAQEQMPHSTYKEKRYAMMTPSKARGRNLRRKSHGKNQKTHPE